MSAVPGTAPRRARDDVLADATRGPVALPGYGIGVRILGGTASA